MTRWAENLERLRAERRLSKVALAQLIGISPTQLGDLLNPTANPETRTLQRVADGLGVDLGELFQPLDGRTAPIGGHTDHVTFRDVIRAESFTRDDAHLVAGLVKLFTVASVQAPRDTAAAILLELAYALAITADPSPTGLALASASVHDARQQRAERLREHANAG